VGPSQGVYPQRTKHSQTRANTFLSAHSWADPRFPCPSDIN